MTPVSACTRRCFWQSAFALLLAVLLSGCKSASDGAACSTVAPLRYSHIAVALCDDFPEEFRNAGMIRSDLDVMSQVNVRLLRVGMAWDSIEPTPDTFDWRFWDQLVNTATRRGVRLIPYLCYTPRWASSAPNATDYWRWPPNDVESFERFANIAARRYRNRITSWELWNEPDNPDYWRGTIGEFAELVRAGSRGVRNADPDDSVVLGGISWDLDFLRSLLRDQRLGPAIDVVNLHAYFETWIPGPIEQVTNEIDGAADIIEQFGNGQKIWLAETGYSDYRHGADVSAACRATFSYEHTAEYQAQALVRTFVCAAATNHVSLIAWYRINDLAVGENVIGDVNNRFLGLRTASGQDKPALDAMRLISQLFNQDIIDIDREVKVTRPRASASQIHLFAQPNGAEWLAVWLQTYVPMQTPKTNDPSSATDFRKEPISITIPGDPHAIGATNAVGNALPMPRITRHDSALLFRLMVYGDETQIVRLQCK